MLCKYYLQIGSDKVDIASDDCMEVGGMVANLSDLTVSYKRTDYGGVVRSCGSEIAFIGDAKEALIDYWRLEGVRCKAAFAVYVADENWVYSPLWECPLDFATLSYDSHYCRVGCVDTSAAALIKANRGTRYHYGAVGLSEVVKLDYDRITIANRYKAQMMGTEVSGADTYTQMVNDTDNQYYGVVLALARYEEQISTQNSLVLNDDFNASEFRMDGGASSQYYFKALRDCEIEVDFTQMKIWGTKNVRVYNYNTRQYQTVSTNKLELIYVLHQFDESDMSHTRDILAESDLEKVDGEHDYVYPCGIRGKFHVRAGYSVCLLVYGREYVDASNQWIQRQPYTFGRDTVLYLSADRGEVKWDSRAYNVDMRVIKPVTLLNKLLESIGGSKMQLRGVIDDENDERLRNTVLLPAEEIRGFSGPTLYSSFKQFCEMMEAVFGYVYTIEDAEVENTLNVDVVEFDEYQNSIPSGSAIGTGSLAIPVQKVCYFADAGRFYGVNVKNGNTYCYHLWKGCADYLDYANRYAPYRDRVYFCRQTFVPYQYAGGSFSPFYLEEIDTRYYDKIKGFAGFVSGERDNHGYEGQVDEHDIYYDVTAKMFFCKDQVGNYYSEWDGSEDYNDGGVARERTVFQSLEDEDVYYVCYDGKYLLPYREQDLELDTQREAAIVRFVHRTELFKSDVQEIEPVASPEVKVDAERLFSELRIGYQKQEYDLGNSGNDEWNFASVYTTGNQLSDKRLELICPYRADCYGIEELAGKRNIETSATDSDGDLFLVKIQEPDTESEGWTGKFILDRSITVEGAYTDTVFNATYAPYFCIQANKEYLCSFSSPLRFASTEGNKGIVFVFGGVRITMSVSMNLSTGYRLFGLCDIVVRTSEQAEPLAWNALVSFSWRNVLCQWYVKSVTFNPQRPEVVEYELIGKTV